MVPTFKIIDFLTSNLISIFTEKYDDNGDVLCIAATLFHFNYRSMKEVGSFDIDCVCYII